MSDVTAELQAIFDRVFRRTDIEVRPSLTAADVPGWDSFRYVSLILATEEHFGIKFTDAELDSLTNVGELLRAIDAKQAR